MKTLELILILIILLGSGYLSFGLSVYCLDFYNKWKECKKEIIIWLVYSILCFITIGLVIGELIIRINL